MHRLGGPRAKVKRAKSELVALNATSERFFKENPYSVIKAEFNKKAGCYSLRIKDCPPPFPIEWSVTIGEIAHNLRSALDGLAWQLALLKTSSPYGKTAFPVYSVGRSPKTRNGNPIPQFWHDRHGLRLLQSVCRRYWTRIEVFQPYKRGNNGQLLLLHELNNTDKHRLITVLATAVHGMAIQGISGGSRVKMGIPLEANAKVGTIAPLPSDGVLIFDIKAREMRREFEVQVDVNVYPQIRFGSSCDAVKGLPVIGTLQSISYEVSRIIESFTNEF